MLFCSLENAKKLSSFLSEPAVPSFSPDLLPSSLSLSIELSIVDTLPSLPLKYFKQTHPIQLVITFRLLTIWQSPFLNSHKEKG